MVKGLVHVVVLWLVLVMGAGPGLFVVTKALAPEGEHHCACPLTDHDCDCPLCAGLAFAPRSDPERDIFEEPACAVPEAEPRLRPLPAVLLAAPLAPVRHLLFFEGASLDVPALTDGEPREPEPPPPRLRIG